MTITFFDTYLLLESDYITEALINAGGIFNQLDISGNINCCTQNCGQQSVEVEVDLTAIVLPATIEFTVDNKIKIFPGFFGLTEFIDGIYKFSIKRYQPGEGTVIESNCLFIDMTLKCKVATLLGYIIEENKTRDSEEKIATIAHLLHYSLVNGSNCGCNCEEMCEVFRELNALLVNVDPTITNDCGC